MFVFLLWYIAIAYGYYAGYMPIPEFQSQQATSQQQGEWPPLSPPTAGGQPPVPPANK